MPTKCVGGGPTSPCSGTASRRATGIAMGDSGEVVERTSSATTVLIGLALMGLAACAIRTRGGRNWLRHPNPPPHQSSQRSRTGGSTSSFLPASPDLSLGAPIVRPFDGLLLADIAVSPDADAHRRIPRKRGLYRLDITGSSDECGSAATRFRVGSRLARSRGRPTEQQSCSTTISSNSARRRPRRVGPRHRRADGADRRWRANRWW